MSEVYFSRIGQETAMTALQKITAKFPEIFEPGDYVAVKAHFGESGNKTYIPAEYLKPVLSKVKEQSNLAFVTDTNVLYRSRRAHAITHYETAAEHGFSLHNLAAPVIIADGIKGGDVIYVEIKGEYFEKFPVAGNIVRADGLVAFSHFKGHLLAGIGGAIKNISMGGASRAGKQIMHADVEPQRNEQQSCLLCGYCVESCPVNAVCLGEFGPEFDLELCIGCGECIAVCPNHVIKILWNESPEIFAEKLAEGALACIKNKPGKLLFITGAINITPECDCMSNAGEPFMQDVGWFMSTDPVAVDQACFDMVKKDYQQQEKSEQDPFKIFHPHTYFEKTLKYAEKLGMGSTRYELIEL
ncbi:MAG: DUF362 domain-containing protein [bacterium]